MADKKDLYGYEEEDIITLEYDDGVEEECGILGVFDALGKEYIALNPLGTEVVFIYGKRNIRIYVYNDIVDGDRRGNIRLSSRKINGKRNDYGNGHSRGSKRKPESKTEKSFPRQFFLAVFCGYFVPIYAV